MKYNNRKYKKGDLLEFSIFGHEIEGTLISIEADIATISITKDLLLKKNINSKQKVHMSYLK